VREGGRERERELALRYAVTEKEIMRQDATLYCIKKKKGPGT
jgi:hypothetical protein